MNEDEIIPFIKSLSGKRVEEAHGEIIAEALKLLVEIREEVSLTRVVLGDWLKDINESVGRL